MVKYLDYEVKKYFDVEIVITLSIVKLESRSKAQTSSKSSKFFWLTILLF